MGILNLYGYMTPEMAAYGFPMIPETYDCILGAEAIETEEERNEQLSACLKLFVYSTLHSVPKDDKGGW